MTEKLPFESLRDCFAAIFDHAEEDPIEHILALTYEFQDQQLLNLLAGRPLDEKFEPRDFDLKRISALAPVVAYDARKTAEGNLVPHFMELLPVAMPSFSCHHSKAYLVVTRDTLHLLLGSMNLTATGLFSNREVLCEFQCSAGARKDTQVLADFAELLASGYTQQASPALDAVVAAVRGKLAAWGTDPDAAPPSRSSLLSSGYGAARGLDALSGHWRSRFGDRAPDHVFAVSPFFDKGLQGPVFGKLLGDAVGKFGALRIVTGVETLPCLSLRHFNGVKPSVNVIEETIGDGERRRIETANDGISSAGLPLRRKLHAKILVLCLGDECLVYAGSANFTCKAWDGTNRELGAVWFETGAKALCDTIAAGLGATKEDKAASLPELPAASAELDDDDYVEDTDRPDFVLGITLKETAEGLFRFEVLTEQPEHLATYEVSWGSERLVFREGHSLLLDSDTLFARLLGGRNLKFVPQGKPDRSYFVPFRHAPELFAKRDLFLHKSAEDWMLFQLGIDTGRQADCDEYLPATKKKKEKDAERWLEVDRGQNAVIRMQRYLTLFGRIEQEFQRRASVVTGCPPTEQIGAWERSIATPLRTLASVLARAVKDGINLPHGRAFQLGELSLLAGSVAGPPAQAKALAHEIAQLLPLSADEPALASYLTYCTAAT